MNDEIQPTLVESGSPVQPARPSSRPMNSLAVTGFVVSFFCGIAGLIMCFIARGQINASGGLLGGRGFTTAGIFVSIASLIVNTIYIIAEVSSM